LLYEYQVIPTDTRYAEIEYSSDGYPYQHGNTHGHDAWYIDANHRYTFIVPNPDYKPSILNNTAIDEEDFEEEDTYNEEDDYEFYHD
jgi:hypothetical protein